MITKKYLLTLLMTISLTTILFAQVNLTVEKYKLKNGLEVILYENHNVPLVAVNVYYKVGSGNEVLGRSGFAHLFEHMMFQGSQNVGDDQHFKLISQAGGDLNGTTNTDRTNYFETLPSNYLELGLWLESDRMGFLLPSMTQAKLDNQRDVVKNERRQRYENTPYGLSWEILEANMYQSPHPYNWTTIGSMADLSAASLEDVQNFFKKYYSPANASLTIAGDFNSADAKKLVEKYFGDLPNHIAPEVLVSEASITNREKRKSELAPLAKLTETKTLTKEDNVKLPRLYLAYPAVAVMDKGDAELEVLSSILTSGKNSRLYKALVYEKKIAQSVSAFIWQKLYGGEYHIQVTAVPGVSLKTIKEETDKVLDELIKNGVTDYEVRKSVNGFEAQFIYGLEGINSVADQLNNYNFLTGTPNYFNQDIARYTNLTAKDITEQARKTLSQKRFELSIVPIGQTTLSAEQK